MSDTVEVIGKESVIQHGKHNDRVYLMKLKEQDADIILGELSNLADKNKYSKIFCKVPGYIAPLFFSEGYIMEACIPHFYNNQHDAFFVSKFLSEDRRLGLEKNQLKRFNQLLSDKYQKKIKSREVSPGYRVKKLTRSDVNPMASIYREVFESYPFPIYNPDYILKTMGECIQYFGAEKNGKLAALASSEIDFEGKNAEMTRFYVRALE